MAKFAQSAGATAKKTIKTSPEENPAYKTVAKELRFLQSSVERSAAGTLVVKAGKGGQLRIARK